MKASEKSETLASGKALALRGKIAALRAELDKQREATNEWFEAYTIASSDRDMFEARLVIARNEALEEAAKICEAASWDDAEKLATAIRALQRSES